jgi:hypothetical protein
MLPVTLVGTSMVKLIAGVEQLLYTTEIKIGQPLIVVQIVMKLGRENGNA